MAVLQPTGFTAIRKKEEWKWCYKMGMITCVWKPSTWNAGSGADDQTEIHSKTVWKTKARVCVHACTREHTHKVFLKIWRNSSLNSLLMECKMANQAQAFGKVGMPVQKCTRWDLRKVTHSSIEKQSLEPAFRVSPKLSTHRPEPFQCLRTSLNGK